MRRHRACRGSEIDPSGNGDVPAGLFISAKERRRRTAQHRHDLIRRKRLKLTEHRSKVLGVLGDRFVGENLDIGPDRGLLHALRVHAIERDVVADDRDAADALALEPAHEAERNIAIGRDRLEGVVIAADAGSVDEVLAC